MEKMQQKPLKYNSTHPRTKQAFFTERSSKKPFGANHRFGQSPNMLY
jgi:hypothetical protein